MKIQNPICRVPDSKGFCKSCVCYLQLSSSFSLELSLTKLSLPPPFPQKLLSSQSSMNPENHLRQLFGARSSAWQPGTQVPGFLLSQRLPLPRGPCGFPLLQPTSEHAGQHSVPGPFFFSTHLIPLAVLHSFVCTTIYVSMILKFKFSDPALSLNPPTRIYNHLLVSTWMSNSIY